MGPRLFLVYINDIDNDDIISKFANDRKLCGKNGGETDTKILQDDFERLSQWSENWQLLFNIDRCSVMHTDREKWIVGLSYMGRYQKLQPRRKI